LTVLILVCTVLKNTKLTERV